MIKEAIANLITGNSLTTEQSAAVMTEIMEGSTTPAQLGAFLTALRIKGETAEEIAGLAGVMRAKANRVTGCGPVLDIVGTGGDGSNTFNISTAAAFVVAGAGVRIAKHGNRAASSQCGSADVLEALGVKIELNAGQVQSCLEKVGIGFMFAPIFHPAMKHAAATRREIGIRTVFNILGPLTNPAGAEYMVLGLADGNMLEKMALALRHLGVIHALLVHSTDGLDEISICSTTEVYELSGAGMTNYLIQPGDFGLARGELKDLKGGTAAQNAAILRSVLSGAPGHQRNVVLINTAAGLFAANKVNSLKDGISLGASAIDNGSALAKLDSLIRYSRELAGHG